MTRCFLVKLNCQVHLGGAKPHPDRPADWTGAQIDIPPSRALGRSDAATPTRGDVIYVWTHKSKKHGAGLGLTAKAKAGEVVSTIDGFKVTLSEVELLRPHLHLDDISEGQSGSRAIEAIRGYTHLQSISLTAEEAGEFDTIQVAWRRNKQKEKSAHEDRFLNERELAIKRDLPNILKNYDVRSQLVEMRLGQSAFRSGLLRLYGGRCIVTRTSTESVLTAAHIVPYSENVPQRDGLDNGLLLRADIHALFDRLLITISPETMHLETSELLQGSIYANLNGKEVAHFAAYEHIRMHWSRFGEKSRKATP